MNKNTISKWFSMFVLMMVAGITGATAQSLTVADFAIEQGATKEIAISVAAAEGQAIYGIQTDITLSEGLTLTNAAAVDNGLMFTKNTLQTGPTRVSLLSKEGANIAAGEAIKLTVTAASNFAGGTIALTNSKLTTSTAGAEINVENVTANVTRAEAASKATLTYALEEGETHTSGELVEVKDEKGAVIATLTFGESGSNDFKAAKADGHVNGFTAFTEGNGTNGNKEGGTFYFITPMVDATIKIAVVLNSDKAFYIEEDGTALTDYNGIKVDAKYYGTFEFNATANKTYKVYAAGTKLGFYGFNITYTKGNDPVDPLAAAKEALQTAIAIASNINPEGFADAITAAQAALRAEDATAESIAQAAQTLETAIKTYFGEVLPRLGAIVKGLNDSTLNAAYANAQNVLATEGVTPQALAAAMQQIITTAKEVAPEHLQNLRGYAVKYGAEDAVALVDNALAAINAGNVSQIIATMAAVNNAATPIAQQVLGGIIGYVQAFGLTEQAIQAKAALESGNYVTMITVAKALYSHLIVAAKDYLPKLGAIVQGLNDSILNAAYANAQTVLANENVTPENLGAAMQQIIVAAKAVAPAHLQNLRGYAVKYGQEGTAALVDSAMVAINEGNVSKIIATMTAVKETATPLATNILQQMVRYAQSYAGFEADVTEAQAALRGGNYITMITTAKALYAKLIAAANDYVAKAKAIPTEGKEGVTELNAAISAAEQALTAQDADFSGINTAISNLVAAVKAFEEANKPATFDPATAIVNAEFNPEADPLGWEKVNSAQFYDLGMGLIGTYQVRGEHSASTVDETHLATEFAAGLECRWNTNYAAFTQTTAELPAGSYKLSFDVENTNATTTQANYENRFFVKVGETTYNDESTEWMNGKSAWTTHAITFTLTEASPITISLGYGTGSNNFGVGNTPALFVSHLMLDTCDPLVEAKAKAIAALETLAPIGEGLFFYNQTDIDNAKNAINAAETVEAVAAVAMPKATAPAADKAYAFQLRLDGETPLYMALAEGGITIAEEATALKFIAVEGTEGQYNLSNEDGTLFVGLAGGNAWTMSTLPDQKAAWTFTALPDGAYHINNLVTAGRFVGTNSSEKTAGSPCYADKQTSNGNVDWIIAEYVAPATTDYTSYIVNADLKGEGGFDAAGTKGIDGSGIVKAANNAQFDFKQTIANLPAGKYKLTAQAAYRYSGSEADEAAAIAAGTDTKLAKLYASVGGKTVETAVMNRYDGASTTDYAAGNGSVTVNDKFVPNSSSAVQAWFAAGQYVNEVVFNVVEAGDVTIGIVKFAQPEAGDYTVIGPWTLTRLGDAEAEPEPIDPTDYTSKIVNPSFEDGTTGWTYEPSNDHGAKENSNGTYTMTGCDGNYIFNIWSSGNAISQKVEGLPNGTYKLKAVIATDGGHKVQLNANGKSVQIDAIDKGTGVEGELEFNVLDGTATIGAEGVDKYWYKVDNFRLYFVKAFDMNELVTAYETALADAKTVGGNMNAEVKTALDAAIAAEVDKTNADALGTATAALVNATADAKASIAAYTNAANVLPKMKELTESTNVYTAEAYEQYYNQWVVKYEAATLTTTEANALQDPFLVTGWHANITCDNFLLSAWDTNPDFQNAPYYINSWSVEGENDGSNFKVPFFEYWTGDGDSLGEKVLTATMNGLEAGDYDVTAWVRVRAKNGYTAPAYGITLQANEGEDVNIAAGDQVGTSQFYLKEFTATGTVAEDGVLKIKFNVAADNNISWLSFKNMKFTKRDGSVGINNIAAGKQLNSTIYNMRGQKVEKAVKGLYIVNGKKVVVK